MLHRTAALLFLFAIFAPGRGSAEPAQAPAPQRALLDLTVNQAPPTTVLVVLLGDDVYLEPKSLQDAGLAEIGGLHRSFDGQEMVSLHSLSPRLGFKVDEDALTLMVVADPALFTPSAIDLANHARPEHLVFKSDLSGFMNYSVEAAAGAGLGGFTELGGSYKTFLFTTGLNRAPGTDHSVRTLTTLTYDQPNTLQRWTFGEHAASTGLLGGSALIAGVGVHREFSLDPYQTHLPLPQLSGTAATPSQLDVYVNGRLVRTQEVPTGVFDVQNLPIPTGAASVRYVLRDAYGRSQELSSRFYLASGLLRRGESDYGYDLGFTRLDAATKSFSFDPRPLLLARHRMGLTDHVTVGGRLELGPSLASGGPSLALGLPIGEFQLSLGASIENNGDAGAAGALSYTYQTPRLGVGGSVQAQSRSYYRAGLAPTDDRNLVSVDLFLSYIMSSGVTLYGAVRHDTWRDRDDAQTFEVRGSYSLGELGSLLLGAERSATPGGAATYGGSVTFAFTLGEHASGQVAAQRTSDHTRLSADVQQSLPTGTGLGYRLHGDDQGGSEALMFQSQYGRYEGDYTNVSGSESAQAFASGSVVLAGGSLFAARPIEQGYAVVRVPGVENVRALLNNQEVGRTNKKGEVLIPNLLPYYGNRLAIVPADIPIDYELPPLEQVIATPNRGGAVVTFKALRIIGLSGSVVMREGLTKLPPAYGQLDVRTEDGQQSSPLGKNGEFYLENLPPGDYPAHVHSDTGDCDFVLHIPDRPQKFVDLGVYSCHGKFETPLTFTQAHAEAAK